MTYNTRFRSSRTQEGILMLWFSEVITVLWLEYVENLDISGFVFESTDIERVTLFLGR